MAEIEYIIRQPTNRTHNTPTLLQHGARHGAWCWKYWLGYLPALGYEVHAIGLPGYCQSSHTKHHINFYIFDNYVNMLIDVVAKISPTSMVVGHSMSGAMLQKYIDCIYLKPRQAQLEIRAATSEQHKRCSSVNLHTNFSKLLLIA